MMRIRGTGWMTTAAAGLALATLLAGTELRGMERAAPEPGIHPTLVVSEPAAGQARVELVLRRVEMAEQIASYQGEITYDRASMQLRRAEVPAGITGLFNEVSPGRIRFAGVKVDGLGAGGVLVLHVTPTRPLAAEHFRVTITEVAATSLTILTPRVATGAAPLVRAPGR
ncbi:MAG TPA: hypothetical protein VE871_17370 [Longimicrobium sp.]|nr:hypothetical protein [Longimicrobium sp.]